MKFRKKKEKKSSPKRTLHVHQCIHLRDSEAKNFWTILSLKIPPSTCTYTHIYAVLFIYGVILVNTLKLPVTKKVVSCNSIQIKFSLG